MKQIKGDIMSVTEGIVVQGCNAKGVMGSGLAKQIRDMYPDVYTSYRQRFEDKGLELGEVVWSPVIKNRPFLIANAITQKNYGRDNSIIYASYDAIAKAFDEIAQVAKSNNLKVHYPMIGAGLGNGDWKIISNIINEKLKDIEHNLWIYEKYTPKFKK